MTKLVSRYILKLYWIDRSGHQIDFNLFRREEAAEIYTKFYSLSQEKQEEIINAAIKEFVRAGFDKASTNEIVTTAQISKGSLFNYFKSKKGLYMFLLDHAAGILEEMYKEINLKERDVFKRIGDIGMLKLQKQHTYPQVFDFLKSVANEGSREVKTEIDQKKDKMFGTGMEKVYSNIDFSKFRPDIDVEKAIDVINWTMIGFGERERNKLDSFEDAGNELLQEWEKYSDLLKQCFY